MIKNTSKSYFVLIPAAFILVTFGQNCSGQYDLKDDAGFSEQFSSGIAPSSIFSERIWSQNKLLVAQKEIIAYVNPDLFSQGTQFFWTVAPTLGSCSVTEGQGTFSMKAVCDVPTMISMTVVIEDPNLGLRGFVASGSLIANNNYLDEQIYYSPAELSLWSNGQATGATGAGGFLTAGPVIDTTAGRTLYQQQCLSCHTPASKAGRTAISIKNAITGQPSMMSLRLSDPELQVIADYLGNL